MCRSYVAGVLVIVAAAAFALTAWAQPAPVAPAVVWEYKSFQRPVYAAEGLEVQMNELGAMGWEFSGAHTATVTQDDIPRPVTVYVFKRAKAAGGK